MPAAAASRVEMLGKNWACVNCGACGAVLTGISKVRCSVFLFVYLLPTGGSVIC